MSGVVARGWHYPRLIAHRGGGVLAPENTMAGMRAARDHGFRGVEFDVMLSADEVPVLMHDPEFGRTIRGKGNVARHTAAELEAMEAGAWLGPAHAGETVPRLTTVYPWLERAGIWMNIEIKPAPGHDAATGRIVAETVQRLQSSASTAAPPPLLSSFSRPALEAARAAAPDLARAMLWRSPPGDWQAQLEELGCVAVHCNHRGLKPVRAESIKQAGFGLMCYTVNEPARAQTLFAWGVDAICTDRLDLFAAVDVPPIV